MGGDFLKYVPIQVQIRESQLKESWADWEDSCALRKGANLKILTPIQEGLRQWKESQRAIPSVKIVWLFKKTY